MNKDKKFCQHLGIVVILSILWKGLLLILDVFPFNADEAIVALMGRHILQGARPTFFYGQAYMGSLDAFLVAGGFALFGEKVLVIRLTQALLYAAFIVSMSTAVKLAFSSGLAGIVTALFLAFPNVNMTLYSTVSLGGYGEALLIGGLLTLLAVSLTRRLSGEQPVNLTFWALNAFMLGGLTGLGLWANALSLVFAAPAVVVVLVNLFKASSPRRGNLLAVFLIGSGLGVLAGSFPWWNFALENGFDHLLAELSGSAVAVEKTSYLRQIFQHLVNFILLGSPVILGIRPPWEIRWLALPFVPFVLVFWGISAAFFLKKAWQERGAYWLFLSPVVLLMGGFLFTSFGVDPSGRYFLPIIVILAVSGSLFVVERVKDPRARLGLIGLVLVFNIVGTMQAAMKNPPGITTQFYTPAQVNHQHDAQLIKFLRENHLYHGYSNYWVAYPLAFLTQEEFVYIPVLPYHPDLRHSTRDNRYAPYNDLVANAQNPAYITTRNDPLNERLQAEFRQLGSTWNVEQIGDFTVFYNLDPAIRYEAIDLTPIEGK